MYTNKVPIFKVYSCLAPIDCLNKWYVMYVCQEHRASVW